MYYIYIIENFQYKIFYIKNCKQLSKIKKYYSIYVYRIYNLYTF